MPIIDGWEATRRLKADASTKAIPVVALTGHAMTGHELIATIEEVTNAKFNIRLMSWWMLKTIGQLNTVGREIAELEYLWRVPHQISGDKLKGVLGGVPHTPLPRAIGMSLRALGLT